MRVRGLLTAYIGWMALITAAYYVVTVPVWDAVVWAVIALSGVVAMFWGVARNRPRRPGPWLLLAYAMVFLGLADTASLFLRADEPEGYSAPIAVHIGYFISICLVFAGLIGLSRTGVPERDRAGLLDAFTVTTGVGLLSWIYLIAPRVTDPGLSIIEVISAAWYPIAMLLILAMVVRLGVGMRPSPALSFLIIGVLALSAGEVIFLTSSLNGRWQVGTVADLGWVLCYVSWGCATLHPSMSRLSEPRLARSGDLNVWRLVLLSCCSLIPSAVLIAMAVYGTVRFELVLGVMGAVMVVLVLARLFGVLRQQRNALARERQLRRAGAALVSVTSPLDLNRVVTGAVSDLMPAGTSHHAMLVLGAWPGEDTGSPLRRPAELPMPYATAMRRYPSVLSCPLTVADHPGAGPELGRLLVGANEDVLGRLHGAVDILAVQAAMALTRIRLTAEISKRDSEAYFRALVHNATDVILIIDDEGMIRYHSPSAFTLLGERVLQRRPISELVNPDRRVRASEIFARMVHGEQVPNDIDWMVQAADGRMLQVSASWRDLRADPTVAGFVITLRDVTEQRRLERELTYRAYHDPLTGLPNRALFAEEVTRAGVRARLEGTVAGVLFIDLDNFKEVNDTMGHLVGDQLLVAVAGRLSGAVRPTDMAARLGGDEFAVLVQHAADSAGVESIADRVVAALSTPIVIGPQRINASGSVGVATTADSLSADLLRDADRALYLAKEAGKGNWRRYSPDDLDLSDAGSPTSADVSLPSSVDAGLPGEPADQ